jgi:hypothetical protein
VLFNGGCSPQAVEGIEQWFDSFQQYEATLVRLSQNVVHIQLLMQISGGDGCGLDGGEIQRRVDRH